MAPGGFAPPATWPLVGRHQELDRLMRSLGTGGGGGAVLIGPPGVGKSRLAAEAPAVAARRGWSCLHAVPSPGAASIPLGGLASLLMDLPAVGQGRSGLVAGALGALGRAGGDRPVLLVVDDAQLLDDVSAAVVHQAVATRTVALVATVRAGDPVPASVTALWKDDLVTRIDVGPLTQEAVEELVRSVLGGDVDGASLHRLWTATEGNPLFLRELLLGAVDSGVLVDERGLWRLRGSPTTSARLHEMVLARIADTTGAERAVLELLALGEPLGLAALVRLASPDALEVLEQRGLITVGVEDRRRPVRLAHPLHGELLRSRMPAIARLRVARLLANDVEALGARRRDDVVRVAVWRLEGGGDTSPDLMAAAARLAYAGRDLSIAERLARAAVNAGADLDTGLLHSSLLAELGRHQEADSVLAGLAASAATDAGHALVALRRSVHLLWALGDDGADAALDRAEVVVTEPAWRAELAAQRANLLALEGRPAEALAAGVGLLESGFPRVAVRAATGAAIARALAGRFDEAIEVAGLAWARQNALADQRGLGAAGFHVVVRILALIDAGRLEEAGGPAARSYDITVETGDAVGQGWLALARARLDHARGQLVTAQRWAGESAAVFADAHQRALRRGALGTLALVAAQRGDPDTALGTVAELDAEGAGRLAYLEPEVDRARAWSWAAAGDLPAARAALSQAARRWGDVGAGAVVVNLAGDLLRLGGRGDARSLLIDTADAGSWPTGDAIRAWAAADDGSALEAVARRFEALGMAVLAAEAAAQAATGWRSGGSARNAHRVATWAEQLAAGTGAATPALGQGGDAGRLTPREQEIAHLAAFGATNRAIAERLALSERTVENHLQRAYVKLGITSRDALAGALGLIGLTMR